jgi:uncharacterized membrane protein
MAEKDLGLKKETAGALAYFLGPVTGIFFLVVSKDPFVRFHAMQSTVTFIVLFVVQWALGITIILFPLSAIVGLVTFVLWLVLIYKAWQGEEWEVPVLGKAAKNLLGKVK